MTLKEKDHKRWLIMDETAWKLADASGLNYFESLDVVMAVMFFK
jgi:hypothetical protein